MYKVGDIIIYKEVIHPSLSPMREYVNKQGKIIGIETTHDIFGTVYTVEFLSDKNIHGVYHIECILKSRKPSHLPKWW